jgi:hypothetical protein
MKRIPGFGKVKILCLSQIKYWVYIEPGQEFDINKEFDLEGGHARLIVGASVGIAKRRHFELVFLPIRVQRKGGKPAKNLKKR